MSDKLEIYKIGVASAENVSERRMKANAFFVTLNTALVGFLGLMYKTIAVDKKSILVFMSAVGIVLSLAWFFSLRSYKRLNKAKYDVLVKIEKDLPYQFFAEEWTLLKRQDSHDNELVDFRKGWLKFHDRYTDLTNIEALAPIAFGSIYTLTIIGAVFGIFIK